MSQTQTNIGTKNTGDSFTASEFNTLNNTINLNSTDAESRLVSTQTDNSNLASRITTIEGTSVPILSYTTENLPATAETGTVAYDTTDQVIVYHKNGNWYKISDNPIVSGVFTFNVKTDNSGESASNQFKIGTIDTGVYDFTVEWGDGSSDVITTWDDPALTYTYSVAGTYTIMIYGNTFESPRNAFPFGGDAPKILDVSNFGLLSYGNSAELTFYGATNMTFSASDIFNTSVTTNFQNAWNGCSSLTSFPLIDTSSGTNFQSAWEFCSSLTSFPLIDTSSVTNFRNAWQNCSSLTAFPLIDTSSGTNFNAAWRNCSSLTSFPLIDTSLGTNFIRTWQNCSSLTAFPLIDTSSGADFQDAWNGCSSLTSFPLIDTSSGTNFQLAWSNCALNSASIDNIMQSLVNNGQINKITSVDGGTSLPFASWSAGAQANFNILISRGWTITTN